MTNTNKENANSVEVNENGTGNCSGAKGASGSDNTINRSFGVTDLWSIRRNTRTLKIHNRIPRL
ncbi:MAG: hypothetical protein ACXVLT_08955 [Flavisolibacter sp.]